MSEPSEVAVGHWAVTRDCCSWCGCERPCAILHAGYSDGAHERELACANCLRIVAATVEAVESHQLLPCKASEVRDGG
jgi:hypothetical protein